MSNITCMRIYLSDIMFLTTIPIQDRGKFMSFGVTDLPLMSGVNEKEPNVEDLLNISKYIQGLKKFVTTCPTPMSIAIQGDWGTGKTSMINCLNQELLQQGNIKTIYFNTWQYAQFNMDEDLYFSFLTCLIDKMNSGNGVEKLKDTAMKLLKFAWKTGKNIIPFAENIDEESAKAIFISNQIDKAQSISKIRDEFQMTVKDYLDNEKSRLVIFIDDLDRLNPDVAVELLEAMKLFLDVKQCVFILAIDYDVVVQGVRKKFGNDTSLEKCKSFFDKIIQLPFHMPVESYSLDILMKKHLNNIISDKYVKHLSEFVKETVGPNPRTFKRLVNSFLLIQSVQEFKKDEEIKIGELETAILFCSLCLQMSGPELYTYLLTSCGWYEDEEQMLFDGALEAKQTSEDLRRVFKDYVEDYKDLTDRKVDKIGKVIDKLGVVLKKICSEDNNKIDSKEIINRFNHVMKMSSITSVSTSMKNIGKNERKAAVIVKQIVVEGIECKVKDASDAIVQTFQIILSNHKDLMSLCKEKILMITDDETKENSVFRTKVSIKVGEEILYLGTSIGFTDKCIYMNKISTICGLSKGSIRWTDGNNTVYNN